MRLLSFFILIAFVTSIFWVTDLDLQVAQYFYHPENQDAWFEGDYFLWDFFYQLGPVISILIAVGSIFIIMLSGLRKRWNHLRVKAVFILVCFVVGPGLIVNALFKDHWGRPRPAQVIELGGTEAYVPPLMFNASGDGKSFPSGHSSVGFALIAFYFLFRRKSRVLARLALALSLVIGSLLGGARIAAGGHFLSDVLWSAFITFLVSLGLYTLFKKKIETESGSVNNTISSNILISGIAFIVLAFGLFNWPVKEDKITIVNMDNISQLLLSVDPLEVTLISVDAMENISIQKQVRGFGFPATSVSLKESVDAHNTKKITLEVKGFLTELEGGLTIKAPKDLLLKIKQD